ncbi:MAG TPA: ribonuclease HII [candidate division Zixibacteria bacterium]|nr:ribonuclease HII [candidate division Zixibacteria bacterium]
MTAGHVRTPRNFSPLERRLIAEKVEAIAGIDEVGIGCLAGPVVAGAVVWDYGAHPSGITDSKLLSKNKRRELFEYITQKALSISVGWASPAEIDALNVLEASRLAMRRALASAELPPEFVIIDGNKKLPGIDIPQEAVVGGDKTVMCVSAASIVAKVLRDELMAVFDALFPGYGLRENVGYPTKQHKEAIARLGATAIHRKTYSGVREHIAF